MTDTELVDLLASNGIEGAKLVGFLATVDHFEASLIRLLVAYGGDVGAKAALSGAQAAMADATGEGWTEIKGAIDVASGEVVDPEQHP